MDTKTDTKSLFGLKMREAAPQEHAGILEIKNLPKQQQKQNSQRDTTNYGMSPIVQTPKPRQLSIQEQQERMAEFMRDESRTALD